MWNNPNGVFSKKELSTIFFTLKLNYTCLNTVQNQIHLISTFETIFLSAVLLFYNLMISHFLALQFLSANYFSVFSQVSQNWIFYSRISLCLSIRSIHTYVISLFCPLPGGEKGSNLKYSRFFLLLKKNWYLFAAHVRWNL